MITPLDIKNWQERIRKLQTVSNDKSKPIGYRVKAGKLITILITRVMRYYENNQNSDSFKI